MIIHGGVINRWMLGPRTYTTAISVRLEEKNAKGRIQLTKFVRNSDLIRSMRPTSRVIAGHRRPHSDKGRGSSSS